MNFINWVDVISVAILWFGIKTGRKSDLFTELIVLCGVLVATAFALHFYVRFGIFLGHMFVLPAHAQDVIAFTLIAATFVGLTLLVKGGWLTILKVNINRHIDNWGSLIFAVAKSYFLCGLLIFAFIISGFPAVESYSRKSLSYIVFRKAPLSVYDVFYTGFIGNFFKEPINQKAFKVINKSSP